MGVCFCEREGGGRILIVATGLGANVVGEWCVSCWKTYGEHFELGAVNRTVQKFDMVEMEQSRNDFVNASAEEDLSTPTNVE